MDEKQLTFLLELLMTRDERLRLAELRENPRDELTRNEYVDFLLEQGRDASAELMRKSPWLPVGAVHLTDAEVVEFQRQLEDHFRANIRPMQILPEGMIYSGGWIRALGGSTWRSSPTTPAETWVPVSGEPLIAIGGTQYPSIQGGAMNRTDELRYIVEERHRRMRNAITPIVIPHEPRYSSGGFG